MLHESKILTASFQRLAVVSEGLNLSIYILDATILCHVLLTKCYQAEVPPMLMVRRALPAGARWPALHRGKSEEVKSKSLHCSLETVKLGRDSLLLSTYVIYLSSSGIWLRQYDQQVRLKVMKETGKMERDNTSIFLAPNCQVSSQRWNLCEGGNTLSR